MQHVVQPVKLAAALDGDHIARLFDHADHLLVSSAIHANRAQIRVGDVVTHRAELQGLLGLEHRLRDGFDFFFSLREQVKREALSAFRAHAGQPREFADQLNQGVGIFQNGISKELKLFKARVDFAPLHTNFLRSKILT